MTATFDKVDSLVIDRDGKLRAKIKSEFCVPKHETHYFMITGFYATDILVSFIIISITREL